MQLPRGRVHHDQPVKLKICSRESSDVWPMGHLSVLQHVNLTAWVTSAKLSFDQAKDATVGSFPANGQHLHDLCDYCSDDSHKERIDAL